jgi:hypothetical protein
MNDVYSLKYLHHFDVFYTYGAATINFIQFLSLLGLQSFIIINITNSTGEGNRPTTSYRNACSLHPTPLFNSSCTLYLYHTTANAPYYSQLAANFKCSKHPTFLLEGLSLQLDARACIYRCPENATLPMHYGVEEITINVRKMLK